MEKLTHALTRPDRRPTSTRSPSCSPASSPRRSTTTATRRGRSTSTCCARSSPTTSSRDRRSATSSTGPASAPQLFAANAPIAKTLRPVREESVDFDTTKNLFIEGDNLDALKLLQESYLGKVKLIYIDPPYNTGNDFVYEDDFAETSDEYLRALRPGRRRRRPRSSRTPSPTGGSTPTG